MTAYPNQTRMTLGQLCDRPMGYSLDLNQVLALRCSALHHRVTQEAQRVGAWIRKPFSTWCDHHLIPYVLFPSFDIFTIILQCRK
jgi:hypothetical protein